MTYNIYLNSPQLAYNANKKKYYLDLINKNNKTNNNKFSKYTPQYFNTSYDSIYYPDIPNTDNSSSSITLAPNISHNIPKNNISHNIFTKYI